MPNCPICKTPDVGYDKNIRFPRFTCDRCGTFIIPSGLHNDFLALQNSAKHEKICQIISHYTRKSSLPEKPVFLDIDLLQLLENSEPPTFPMAQANNVLIWFGDEGLKKPGKKIQPDQWDMMIAVAGAPNYEALKYIIDNLREQNLLEDKGLGLQLTFNGWERYEELKRNKSDSKSAFMAMQFDNKQLMNFYKSHLRDSVKASGFELSTVEPKAGIINDHIMNGIRLARFVIADLTDRNNGAYWEAGFAEGLGKPVFYTCREDKFDGGKGIHFDTNHHRIIPWKDEHDIEAANNLKEAIRNTLTSEAIMEDSEA